MNSSATSQLTAMNRTPLLSKPGTSVVSAAPPRKSRAKWVVLTVVLLTLGVGGGVFYKNKTTDKGFAITTEKAVIKTITQVVNATGKIQPEVEVKISPEVAGEIVELTVREGT